MIWNVKEIDRGGGKGGGVGNGVDERFRLGKGSEFPFGVVFLRQYFSVEDYVIEDEWWS